MTHIVSGESLNSTHFSQSTLSDDVANFGVVYAHAVLL